MVGPENHHFSCVSSRTDVSAGETKLREVLIQFCSPLVSLLLAFLLCLPLSELYFPPLDHITLFLSPFEAI